jgi:8-oxo-dGTP diphosphatase
MSCGQTVLTRKYVLRKPPLHALLEDNSICMHVYGRSCEESIRRRGSVAAMIRVVAGIIEQYGRVLICRRQAGRIFGGKWEFPGGKMRPSEMPRQALERELREELGVTPKIGDLVQMVRYRYAEMSEAVHISFLSAALEDPPRNRAFERIVWAPRAELPRYDFLAADRLVVSELVRGEDIF